MQVLDDASSSQVIFSIQLPQIGENSLTSLTPTVSEPVSQSILDVAVSVVAV
jgi:hypothetical protein